MKARLERAKRSLADIDIQAREVIGRGWGKIERFTFRHTLYRGGWSAPVTRDIYTIGEVVTVLPYDPALDAVVLVEQVRACGFVWGEATWLFEVVAGVRDAEGESIEEVARREAREEAACTIEKLVPMLTIYSSPGGHGERCYLFAGRADLSQVGGLHGLAEEGEDIRTEVVPLDEALAAVDDGRLSDAKTVISIQWLARHRDLLRD